MIYAKTTVRPPLNVIVPFYRKVDVYSDHQKWVSNVISVLRNEENGKTQNLRNSCFSNLTSGAISVGTWANFFTESSNIIYFEATNQKLGIHTHY